jgi:replicative DNA helicase
MTEQGEPSIAAQAAARRRVTSKSSAPNIIAQQFGKLPPQAVDLEEAVLGALMLEKDALTDVIEILHPEAFYKDSHRMIFSAIHRLFHRPEPVDILTVTNELKKSGELDMVGGPFAITQLTNRVASAANIKYHTHIILQKHIQRELIRISSETIKDAYEDTTDVFSLLDRIEKNIYDVTSGNIKKNYQAMNAMVSEAYKQIEEAKKIGSGINGVESGFTELDRITSGWQKSDLVVIAARPGMGKSALVLSLARNSAVEFKKPVAVFSLEMNSIQLVQRLIASETGIDSDKLKKGKLNDIEWKQLVTMTGKLSDAPIYIDDSAALSIFDFRSKCRRLKLEHDVQLIIIDYLQLMRGETDNKNGNREQEISLISRSLKAIAKELNVPIIALSQLSRAVETRGGTKRPQLSDLRESGAIEQDADMVIFIYRPEYYDLHEDESGQSTKGMAELIIAKHRNGTTGSVKLKFIGHLAKFADSDYNETQGTNSISGSVVDYQSNRVIVGSRMNDMKDDDEPSPF